MKTIPALRPAPDRLAWRDIGRIFGRPAVPPRVLAGRQTIDPDETDIDTLMLAYIEASTPAEPSAVWRLARLRQVVYDAMYDAQGTAPHA